MNKTLAVLGNITSSTTSSISASTTTSTTTTSIFQHIQPTRAHSTTNLLNNKNKENVTDKNNRTSRSREALSNITNANNTLNISKGGGGEKTNKEDKTNKPKAKREKSKSTKITKRSAAVMSEAESNGGGCVEAKKRKSDPMVIDVDSHECLPAILVAHPLPPHTVAVVSPPITTVATVPSVTITTTVSGASIPSPPLLPEWEDIDANDGDDPQAVSEYVNEIYDNLKEKELRDRINPNYISLIQHDINEKMRSILIDWLIEVHRMFKLLPETLFLASNIIDRYLQSREVSRDKLQLVGITSMLIASKYEEIFAPECNDFVYISDGAYTKEQILTMEQTILNVLAFNLTHPSPLHFLRRYSKAAGSDYTIHTLCKYLIEVMLIDVKLLKYTSSQVAAGSVIIARAMTGKTPLWTATLEHYSGYSEVAVRVVAMEMNEVLKKSKNSSLKALKKKYSTPKYGQVADIPIVDL